MINHAYRRLHGDAIGHFRVALKVIMKARLSARLHMRISLFACESKQVFIIKALLLNVSSLFATINEITSVIMIK